MGIRKFIQPHLVQYVGLFVVLVDQLQVFDVDRLVVDEILYSLGLFGS